MRGNKEKEIKKWRLDILKILLEQKLMKIQQHLEMQNKIQQASL